MGKPDKLTVHIPWIVEVAAEGPVAIAALFALGVIAIVASGGGWW
jgi:hypothetical protein